jgi:hypothetical protein
VEFLPLGMYIPDSLQSTLQACVNAAAQNPRGVVYIPASYSGSDSYSNPSNVPVFDMRGIGSLSFGTTALLAQYATSFSNQTTFTVAGVTHNLLTADLSVTVWNSSSGTRSVIIPNTVTVDSTTFNVTITFVQPQSGRIVISG